MSYAAALALVTSQTPENLSKAASLVTRSEDRGALIGTLAGAGLGALAPIAGGMLGHTLAHDVGQATDMSDPANLTPGEQAVAHGAHEAGDIGGAALGAGLGAMAMPATTAAGAYAGNRLGAGLGHAVGRGLQGLRGNPGAMRAKLSMLRQIGGEEAEIAALEAATSMHESSLRDQLLEHGASA
jgi:phage tail tape-measure protein